MTAYYAKSLSLWLCSYDRARVLYYTGLLQQAIATVCVQLQGLVCPSQVCVSRPLESKDGSLHPIMHWMRAALLFHAPH